MIVSQIVNVQVYNVTHDLKTTKISSSFGKKIGTWHRHSKQAAREGQEKIDLKMTLQHAVIISLILSEDCGSKISTFILHKIHCAYLYVFCFFLNLV